MPATSGSPSQADEWRMPLEAAVAGLDLGLQHCARVAAEQHIGVADDAGIDPGFAIGALALCAATPLANSTSPIGFIASGHRRVHRAAVDIDGRDDVVAGRHIVGDVTKHVALAGAVPQMVVRVTIGRLGRGCLRRGA